MSNPHVEWLEYELKSRWGFENPPPLNWETPVFSANLNGGTLRISLKEHFPTIESARTAIEAFLQDWEIEVALTHGQREMAFVFKGSHIIDRDPPAPGVAIIFGAAATIQCAGSISAVGTVSLKSYPPVPYNFRAAPDVITLWTRFEGFKKGREPLASMAYFCFTVLKNSFGGVDAASKALAVDRNVLRKLSELSTNRGEPTTARKMTAHLSPITAKESQWLEMTIRALIHRVGEIACGHRPFQLTMKQLPPV